jgi:hypothetical protein
VTSFARGCDHGGSGLDLLAREDDERECEIEVDQTGLDQLVRRCRPNLERVHLPPPLLTCLLPEQLKHRIRPGLGAGHFPRDTRQPSEPLSVVTGRCLSVALTASPVYPDATILGVRRGSRREQSDPSAREVVVLNLERLDQKLGALMSAHFEEWFEQRQLGRRLVRLAIRTHPRTPELSPYTNDPRYQRLERLRTDVRGSLQQIRRQHQPCRPAAARTLRRDCGQILAVH